MENAIVRRSFATAAAALLMALGLCAANPADARKLLQAAVEKARQGQLDTAFELASQAADAVPSDTDYRVVRETFRQRATLAHLEHAHALERGGDRLAAAVEYRSALALDPGSLDALQGLAAVFAPRPPAVLAANTPEFRVRQALPPAVADPTPGHFDLHLHGDLRTVIGGVASTYGLKAYVDNALPAGSLQLDLNGASFSQAMRALRDLAQLDYLAIDSKTLYFGEAKKIAGLTPLAERTFYLPELDGTSLAAAETAVRNLLGITQIQGNQADSAIVVRATAEQLDAAEQMLLDLSHPAGEVLLDVRIVELDDSTSRQLGLQEPTQFNVFSLGPLLAQLSQNAGLEQNILNLFNSGGLNAVLNSGQLNASQLQQAEATLSPLLANPFVVFGGGATLMALSVPSPTLNLNRSDSHTQTIEEAVLRASQLQPADLKVGERYPIVNAIFSPISLSPAITSVIGNLSYTQPFPSFTYEDLGVEVKLTPKAVNAQSDVNLGVNITVKGLTGQTTNGLPVLTNRVYTSQIDLKDGEPIMMAGMLDQEDTPTITGIPGLSTLPGLGPLFGGQSVTHEHERLVFLVTPHVVRDRQSRTTLVWLPPGFAPAIENGGSTNFFPGLVAPQPAGQQPGQPGIPGATPGAPGVAPNGAGQPLTAPVQPGGGRGGG